MPDKKPQVISEVHSDETLQVAFIDNLGIAKRTDGMHYVRLMTSVPEGHKEQYRMMVPDQNLKRMLDVLCRHCDYFPVREKQKAKRKPKKSRPKTKASRKARAR